VKTECYRMLLTDSRESLEDCVCCCSTHGAPRAQSFVKVGARAPVPYGVDAMAYVKLILKIYVKRFHYRINFQYQIN